MISKSYTHFKLIKLIKLIMLLSKLGLVDRAPMSSLCVEFMVPSTGRIIEFRLHDLLT